MASTITVKEALWRAGVILQDVSPQFVRHPEAELVTWTDDAQLALFKFLPSSGSRIDTVNRGADQCRADRWLPAHGDPR